MTIIEVPGWVNEQGHVEFEAPSNLRHGEVRITIESVNSEAEALDDALWEQQFANSPETLDYLAREAREEYYNGSTDEFDPDNDPDAP